ncbi:MAG: EAL domain-containing protein [Methyloversatilis discipulorum]|jgi:diguanylate cyclase (GGDEF)-like protein/PAS domain S-box-containing protein|uniref:two-component system response regulator n=1 Tax=Methyloversatilis discipulorum TaxID=1119528 RepID=UPI0026ECD294|nr:EAL domain-containing protein [Methyloversatilis discipulorum]MBV5287770.1 EAL domain-containing protein [Methyloversatilis discipulorum]
MNAPLPVNLMLVEDERVIAFDLKNQLQSFGYKVGAVLASGEQAVRKVGEVAPDLVLMDIHLEGPLDGIDAALQIQLQHRVPVVFLTAYAEDDTLRRALDCRPFGYLVKPCEARELHATIQMALARRAVEVTVERSEQLFKQALDAASLGVIEWQGDSMQLHGDGHLRSLFGDRPVPLDESWNLFLSRVDAADRERVSAALNAAIQSGDPVRIEFRTVGNGGARCLEAHARAYGSPAGEQRIVGILQDVTQRRRDEERLRQSSVVFHTTAEAIVIADARRHIVAVNAAYTRITGHDESEVLGLDPDAVLGTGHGDDFYAALVAPSGTGYWQGEVLCKRASGDTFPAWESISAVRNDNGAVTHFVAAFSDFSAIHQAEEKLNHLAHHDALTGLPNRLLFDDRFERAIEQARRAQQRCILLFLDLDSFKGVNDTLGHGIGDELLRAVSVRLREALRRSDTLARLGGDEFVVLTGSAQPEDASHLAMKLLSALRDPFDLGDEQIRITGSIGIAVFPDHGADRNVLMRAADIAMYSAKSQGRNRYQFFTADMSERTQERMQMEQGLRRAIDNDALEVHYQPQLRLSDAHVIGVEALVRWPHPELGMISPARFIPVAEESGIIETLGMWVLRRACHDIVGLPDNDGRQMRLAVNVSVRQFMREDFVAHVLEVLTETGFPAESLELEITESTLQVIEHSAGILDALKRLGISISIDDFGTGYSSLSVLRGLPIDRIKIDRSFIIDLTENEDARAMIEAMLALGHSLRMTTIAEGIELSEQAELLLRLGCSEGQGYLFARPMSATQLRQSLVRPRE